MSTATLFDATPTDPPIAIPAPPRVIGIDPSLTATGIASSLGWCLKVGQSGITTLGLDARLDAIDMLVEQIVEHVGRPELALIEQPAFSRAVGGAMERHALWWLLVRALRRREIPVAIVYARGRMRYATGKGAATKSAVVDAVARRLPMFATGGDDNLADAAVLCAMGADRLGVPMVVMPATHRAALDAVEWPELAGGAPC